MIVFKGEPLEDEDMCLKIIMVFILWFPHYFRQVCDGGQCQVFVRLEIEKKIKIYYSKCA